MNVKLRSDDDTKTLLMNVWLSVYLECGCTPTALEKANQAVKEFTKKFIESEEDWK